MHWIDIFKRDIDSRLAFPEATDQAREKRRSSGATQTDGQRSELTSRSTERQLYRALGMFEDLSGFAEKNGAFGGERHLAWRPLQQSHSDFSFKIADLATYT